MIVAVRMLPITKGLISSIQRLKSNIGAIEIIISRLYNMKKFQENDIGEKKFPNQVLKITFKNVSFKYKLNDSFKLNNINVDFNSEKVNFLIGPSGSGKSTLIDLIPRLRDIDSGGIFINNTNIDDIKLYSLRNHITYISQKNFLLNLSIKDYLKIENNFISDEEIFNAAKETGIHNFIERLDLKYDTIINDNNTNFSGGQIQKIDITRALINNSSIIILDEPTNNLDLPSTKNLFNLLEKISLQGKIIIVISHSLNFIPENSNIVLIQDGNVIKKSSYSDMLETKNWLSDQIT